MEKSTAKVVTGCVSDRCALITGDLIENESKMLHFHRSIEIWCERGLKLPCPPGLGYPQTKQHNQFSPSVLKIRI